MVGVVIVSHSSRLAAGVRELAQEMGGDGVPLAAVGGLALPDEPLGTDPLQIQQAIEQVYGDDGVLVLMDLGSALLSAEMAVEQLPSAWRARVRLVPAPLVEGAVAAVVEARLGAPLEQVATAAARALEPKLAHLEPPPAQPAPTSPPTADADLAPPQPSPAAPAAPRDLALRHLVRNPHGLHARPAARLVQTVGRYSAEVQVRNLTTGRGPASARSLSALMTLEVRASQEVLVTATGPDAVAALAAVAALLDTDFGERAEPVWESVASGTTPDCGPMSVAIGRTSHPSSLPKPVDGPPDQVSHPPAPAASPGEPPARDENAPPDRPNSSEVAAASPVGDPSSKGGEEALQGLAAAGGLALGAARRFRRASTAGRSAVAASPEAEWAALTAALARTLAQLTAQQAEIAPRAGAAAAIFDAARLLLVDDALLAPARAAIFASGQSAAAAWQGATAALAARFRQLEDPYLRGRAADVAGIEQQVLQNLATAPVGTETASPPSPTSQAATVAPSVLAGRSVGPMGAAAPYVLVADELSPAEVAALDRTVVRGICTAGGTPTAHAAILARRLRLPTVVGLGPGLAAIADGTPLLVDGDTGRVWIRPLAERAEAAERAAAARQKQRLAARAVLAAPAITRDGTRVPLLANVGSVAEAREAVEAGAEGVGVVRTEFLFLNRQTPPDEGEQYLAYRAIAAALDGRPVVIRTLDAGGDKPLPYLSDASGSRGLRLLLAQPALFATQLRAIVRAAAEYPIQVMFPMVATLEDWRAARAQLAAARAQVQAHGQPAADRIATGIMVEVPSAVLLADQFAAEVDFLSIGTNDLAQYVYAADRGDAATSALADGFGPALLRCLRQVIEAAHARQRPVTVCGEMASDPLAIPLLLGLGVDELSMAPSALSDARLTVQSLDLAGARTMATAALAGESAAEVRGLATAYQKR